MNITLDFVGGALSAVVLFFVISLVVLFFEKRAKKEKFSVFSCCLVLDHGIEAEGRGNLRVYHSVICAQTQQAALDLLWEKVPESEKRSRVVHKSVIYQ